MDDLDRQVLELEGRWYRHAGAKLQAVRDELDLGPTAYYQRLNRLLDDPAAAVEFPALTNRLRRRRDLVRAQRAARG